MNHIVELGLGVIWNQVACGHLSSILLLYIKLLLGTKLDCVHFSLKSTSMPTSKTITYNHQEACTVSGKA